MSDIDIAVADSLKVLDLKRPIREADIPVSAGDEYLFANGNRKRTACWLNSEVMNEAVAYRPAARTCFISM